MGSLFSLLKLLAAMKGWTFSENSIEFINTSYFPRVPRELLLYFL